MHSSRFPADIDTAFRRHVLSSPVQVFVVIPVHNRRAYTVACLECLSKQTWHPLTVFVVDDGSTDGTADVIARRFPNVIVVHGDGSLWWTGSANAGIRSALARASDCDYVLMLNDDLEVDDHYVETLVHAAKSNPMALIGSVAVDIERPDLIYHGGHHINWWTAKSRILNRGRKLADFPRSHLQPTSKLTGRGTLIPVHTFRKLGLYDQVHFRQCGDTEFPARAARVGYRLFVAYHAIVRSHVRRGGDPINLAVAYRVRDLPRYLFGVKSNTNISYRFHFARTAAGDNLIRFAVFFLSDLTRVLVHFLRRVRLT